MSLEDKKITNFSKPVSEMPDVPGAAGYTAAQVKEWFDSNSSVEIKNSVNGIIDFLLGFTDGEGIKGIRLSEDNVVEVTTDGETYISTGYSQEYITNMLADKADKSDVLLKTNTEEFTPTDTYQPATKKYVDDKVISAGAGDMTQAVYDPTGRQTDIFAEMGNYLPLTGGALTGNLRMDEADGTRGHGIIFKNNGVDDNGSKIEDYDADGKLAIFTVSAKNQNVYFTPNGSASARLFGEHNKDLMAQSFLALTGGKLINNIVISDEITNYPQIIFGGSVSGEQGKVMYSKNGKSLGINASSGSNLLGMELHPNNEIGRKLQLNIDNAKWYNLFGEHNKPSGSYTGNGEATSRTISTNGLGSVLHISSNHGTVIANNAGGFAISTNGAVSAISYNQCHFINGVLTLATTNNIVNANGQSYGYYVL